MRGGVGILWGLIIIDELKPREGEDEASGVLDELKMQCNPGDPKKASNARLMHVYL